MSIALWWARRDLRLTDNAALSGALAHAEQMIPVFVLDPQLLAAHRAAETRVAFMLDGLRALDADLRTRGSYLVVRHGDPVEELAALVAETGAEAIFAEEDFSPYAHERDGRAAQTLPIHWTGAPVVHPPGTVLKADGAPYTVFTPFSRAWKALPTPAFGTVLPAPQAISTPPGVASAPIPARPAMPPGVPFRSGESEAHDRLNGFSSGDDPPIYRYAETRDRVDQEGTSRVSPYLRFGMLSARQAVLDAVLARDIAPDDAARRGAAVWLNELIWREFYVHILYHFPHVLEQSFRPKLQRIAWENDEAAFDAWCAGRTGYPIVDAAMHQLTETGWMHNRARMIIASFLVKDLLIDWRWGERFFMQHLVDGDPASNNGGWQWTAGTGTDAAPYFRIFNPVLQGKKHDPEGAYVRRWVPALARVPARYIHAPWEMGPEVQREAGCSIGTDYPPPIVDHAQARKRTLAAYKQAREAA